MKTLDYKSISSSKQYDQFLKDLYIGVKQKVEEIIVPPVKIIAVEGNEPPASKQYQTAIACLYGIGYTLKMSLKYGKLPKPNDYFDYSVGGLETLWWSKEGTPFEIANPKTLQWKAYLMVPAFVDQDLFAEAVAMAKKKKPEIPYENVKLEELDEGHSVQILHVGPYDQERPTIELLNGYIKENSLEMAGKHHEIYISDPRRTKPEKLKTIIRFLVRKVK
ncbi:hypothetical protein A2V54_01030 [candidate division WWE3 bacterium RBG_19FT_COMBO_53_11]|uniref:GyrI-like small molecule binding domain-containing protein n=1 Tax=candidate division WWE3 bacterium RBG_19FT_COMBO_53_11 TaxID=1802613 RepID=A0A1F4UKK3_UNCKA|nr:MAG: hypothetical protein A2V54_01030 [candidate division WWE3 bacterium RBG_19FT_COMBO_53_11]